MWRPRYALSLSLLVASAAVTARAQDTPTTPPAPSRAASSYQGTISPGEVTPTEQMWFYEQSRRDYADPKMAVRRKAEFRTQQRLARMAAMKWFGYSNARPTVSHDPYNSDWSPSWTGNNWYQPYRWQGYGVATSRAYPQARGFVYRTY